MARRQLGLEERVRVTPVRGDHQDPGVPLAEQLVVEPLAVEQHVREAPAVEVARLDVTFEPHHPTEQATARVRGRLGPEAANGTRRVMGLGRVDPEKPHGVDRAVAECDHDRVAVEHVEDARTRRRLVVLAADPPAARRRGGNDDDRHDHAPGDHGTSDTDVRPR